MSLQSNIEKVLKDLHLLLAKSETYALDEKKIVVEKKKILDLLTELNICISDIMEEYEVTKQSRDKAERDFQRQSDKIIEDANRKAEDIYAASVMYTDEALRRVNGIIDETNIAISKLYKGMTKKIKEQENIIRENQLELISELQDLRDTEKYLKLIDERNKEIKKEKDVEEEHEVKQSSIYANRQTEIRINEEYFEKMGFALEQEAEKEMEQTLLNNVEPDIKVNLDADYFRWKEKRDNEKKNEVSKEKTDKLQNVLKNLNRMK